jgi:16S rRNA (uracil1498-N3)-methyltransferase
LTVEWPSTEPDLHLTIAQALPKGDKIDEIVRACTELGVAQFIFFPSERTVVRWDEKKTASRLHRLEVIAREAAEVCFRTKLPQMSLAPDLNAVLKEHPASIVLSEVEGLSPRLSRTSERMTVVVGPEGGWAPKELALIGDRGVTLGPRVLRVDHAAPAAAAILLLA